MGEMLSRPVLLVVLSAGLQIVIFPTGGPLPLWRTLLSWVALVPLLLALIPAGPTRPTLRRGALLGYLCGFLWYLGSCSWTYQTMYLYGGLPKPVALLILVLFALYLGLYHALFALLLTALVRSRWRPGSILAASPFLWVAVELARSRITSFPWDLLGYTQIDNLFISPVARLTGVMGLSFFVAAVNALLVPTLRPGIRRRLIFPALGAVIVIAVAVAGHYIAHLPTPLIAGDKVAILLQENLQVGAPGREAVPLSREDELRRFEQLSLKPEAINYMGAKPRFAFRLDDHPFVPDVVVWPEAPSHLQSDDPTLRDSLGALARQLHAPLIIGSLGVDASQDAPRGFLLFDSASLFTSDGIYAGRYDKIHLVPWGEYIPFKDFFSFAHKLTEGVGDMDRGTRRTVFAANQQRFGVFICYESIFGDEVRQFVRNGAEVLVNISDDGWFGDTGAPWQHLNMVRMRAIENHRWLLRSTNTGVTTSIDPEGRIALAAPRHVRDAYAFPYALEQDQTIYTRYGDWFAFLCAGVTVAAAGSALRGSRLN